LGWKFVHITCCVVSSYIYALIAAFGDDGNSEIFRDMTIGFETVFLLSMIFNFMKPFYPEGEHHPSKDHGKIARKYINDGFLIDFVTLIPF